MSFKIIGLVILLLAFCLLGGCQVTRSLKFRVTVNVDDNGTIYSGSAVQEIILRKPIKWLGSLAMGDIQVRGEAIPVKIGDKGYLFMLFVNPDYYGYFIQDRESKKGVKSWNISFEQNPPLFVTFGNPESPRTIKAVRFTKHIYKKIVDGKIQTQTDEPNATEIFGSGISLKSIYVERVYFNLITRGQIETILPWLGTIGYNNLEGKTIFTDGESLSQQLKKDNFIRR